MKKIIIFSDTHGHSEDACYVIDREDRVDMIIHAGDVAKDAEDIECIYESIPIYYVCGNCDSFSRAPSVRECNRFGKKFFITHGHGYHVKSETEIDYPTIAHEGKERDADIVVFGHTHIPYIGYYGKSTIINPGSLRYGRTYAICTIDGDKVRADIKKF